MNRAQAIAWFDKASDQDNPYYPLVCYLSPQSLELHGLPQRMGAREIFGVCIDPQGLTFKSAKARTIWLAQRYSELEAEALATGPLSCNPVCTATGGTWSGVSCYTRAGRPYDPHSGR